MQKSDLQQIDEYLWEIPKESRDDARVPARLYASEELLDEILEDKSLSQLSNLSTLPGIQRYALAMPDIHQGYGFPIGGVVATLPPEGIISPGGIGYDINCGVRLMATELDEEEVTPHLEDLATLLYDYCPSGVGEDGLFPLKVNELEDVVRDGARWCRKQGYAIEDDLIRTEDRGRLEGADPSKISQKAMNRGKTQLGTLGGGNHFLEVDVVRNVLYPEAADAFGLRPRQVVVFIHCGSRGFGHQICTDYVRSFQKVVHDYGIQLPDRELVCAPLGSDEGQDYLAAMRGAANFAFTNRQILAHQVRRAFEEVFAPTGLPFDVHQVYDLAHNIGKLEEHRVNGDVKTVCVHRKGATRAFGPGSKDVPEVYRHVGQPVLLPGSMGTMSYILAGQDDAMDKSFGTCAHGAGRAMSRTQARKTIHGNDLREQLEAKGIAVRAGSLRGLAEEAPFAYKDVDSVIEVVEAAGLARAVARVEPIAVIKG